MRYKDDPRQIAARYLCYCEKCQVRLLRGTVAYYWPRTRTLLCSDCGEPEFRVFFRLRRMKMFKPERGIVFRLNLRGVQFYFLRAYFFIWLIASVSKFPCSLFRCGRDISRVLLLLGIDRASDLD